jgi:hypothetical protein
MSVQVIARKAAMNAGLVHYFTAKSCRNGHTTMRFVACGTCLACAREKSLRRHHADPDAAAARAKRFHERNPDYSEKNRNRINAVSRAYRERNKERYAMHRANQRAAMKSATPGWFGEFDEFVISEAFKLAKAREIITGSKWEVDHIIPVSGKNVCGLHVGGNIQVIPRGQNRRKSNKFSLES